MGAGSVAGSLTNASAVFAGMNTFNLTSANTSIQTAMTSLLSTIDQYGLGQVTDISDSASTTILSNLATPSQYSSCSSAQTGFSADSWVPSLSQNPSWVSCSATGSTAIYTNCDPATHTASWNVRGGNCMGCFDTTGVLISRTGAQVLSDLATRYPNAACQSGFNTDLSNVWTNYYLPKISAIHPAVTGYTWGSNAVRERAVTAQTDLNNFINMLNAGTGSTASGSFTPKGINNLFSGITTSLSAITALIDPTYGVLAGLNCRLFGQDFQSIIDVLCINFFGGLYLTRLVLGIASYGLLFSLCCIVCTGVRHYKHSERKDRVNDAFKSTLEGSNNQLQGGFNGYNGNQGYGGQQQPGGKNNFGNY